MIFTEVSTIIDYRNQRFGKMQTNNIYPTKINNKDQTKSFSQFKKASCLQCMTPFKHGPNVKYVRCPRCSLIMNCDFTINYQCKICGTLLSSTSSNTLTQCPTCFDITNLKEREENDVVIEPIHTTKPKLKTVIKKEKRLRNAYMLFCKLNREFVSAKYNGTLSFSDIGVKLGEMWRDLSPNEKYQYQTKFKEFQKLELNEDSDRSYLDSSICAEMSSFYTSEDHKEEFDERENQLLKDTFEKFITSD